MAARGAPRSIALCGDRLAVKLDCAGSRRNQAQHEFGHRRLAATRLTDESQGLASLHTECDAVNSTQDFFIGKPFVFTFNKEMALQTCHIQKWRHAASFRAQAKACPTAIVLSAGALTRQLS